MDNTFERNFWGQCTNTYGEETKQLVYARRMRLHFHHDGRSPYNIDMQRKSVIDIGGGPTSLLLKCTNLLRGVVVDPLEWPQWVYDRYGAAGILCFPYPGEEVTVTRFGKFDEAWIYNCLQHVTDPAKIVYNARQMAKTVRLFEWIDIPPHEGHPQMLTRNLLDQWLGRKAVVEQLNEGGCVGRAYYGVFQGVNHETLEDDTGKTQGGAHRAPTEGEGESEGQSQG